MNILHVIRDLSPLTGGPVTEVLGMAEQQAGRGHRVTIAATDRGIDRPPEVTGVRINLYPVTFPRWLWSRRLSAALPGLVGAADIVHIHMFWEYPTWAAASTCRRLGRPYMISPCGMLDVWALSQNRGTKKAHLYLLGRSILGSAAAIHCTTDRELAGLGVAVDRKKCFVVPVGLPSSMYEALPSRDAFSARVPEAAGRTVVLFLGRLHPKKQPDVAIRAFWLAARERKDIHLVMAGPGDEAYVRRLEELVDHLSLRDRVTFTGILMGEGVREAYAAADIFVLPSLLENFGISVAEAMAAGCAVIVSDQVYLADEILRAGAGIVCPPEAGALAAAMERLLGNAALCRQMGENGRNLVMDRLTWPRVSEQMEGVYDRLGRARESS